MKLICIGLSILACVCAQAPSAEYLPPGADYGASASNVIENNFLDSEPYNTLADDGYRYRTVRRFRLRHRRDVNELSSGYLPPQASAPEPAYSVSSPYDNSVAYSVPAPVYTAPSTVYDASYDAAASEPAHIVAADGYRYKTVKRYRLRQRRRRDVSELASGYLPPQASAPEPAYSAPVSYENSGAYSAPNPIYAAPTPVYDASYDAAVSEPAHIVAADGYRYKTVKRYRLRQRRRRDVSELASGYLPPQASAPEPAYSAPVSYENSGADSAPNPIYAAPTPVYDASYDAAVSEPAHIVAADGYRYKTVKRYRLRQRRRRDVSELASGYLPPQASTPEPTYSAPVSYENSGAYSAPNPVYTAPTPVYDASYDSAASEPAHIVAADGYRYKTVKRYRLRQRRRRDVSELASGYLPPQASAPEPTYSAPVSYENSGVYSAPNPVYTAPTPVYDASYDYAASEPAHIVAADGYRYKTVKRYRLRQRRRRDVSELASGYLPPQASASEPTYSAPASYENVGAYSAPSSVYSAPVQNNDLSYDVAASAPAHSLASDGYRYRTIKRYRYRHRH